MQGSHRAELFDEVADFVGHEGGAVEVLAALNDAVADGDDARFVEGGALRVEEAEDFTHADLVVGDGKFFGGDLVAVGVLDVAEGVADAFDEALGDGLSGFGVDELIFDGRGTGVDDEDCLCHGFAFRA